MPMQILVNKISLTEDEKSLKTNVWGIYSQQIFQKHTMQILVYKREVFRLGIIAIGRCH